MSSLKRFAVFSGATFYPGGGWNDYRGSYATLDEAVEAKAEGDWRHVVDLTTGQICVVLARDIADAPYVSCDMCKCESPRGEGAIHTDSERLGLRQPTPCDRVFAARDPVGWLAYVDGAPLLHERSGEVLKFSSVTVAYWAACAAAPRKGQP